MNPWTWVRSLDHNEALSIVILAAVVHLYARFMRGLTLVFEYDPTFLDRVPMWVMGVGAVVYGSKAWSQLKAAGK